LSAITVIPVFGNFGVAIPAPHDRGFEIQAPLSKSTRASSIATTACSAWRCRAVIRSPRKCHRWSNARKQFAGIRRIARNRKPPERLRAFKLCCSLCQAVRGRTANAGTVDGHDRVGGLAFVAWVTKSRLGFIGNIHHSIGARCPIRQSGSLCRCDDKRYRACQRNNEQWNIV